MEADGLVTTEVEYIGKRMRKYYRLSPAGKAATRERLKELSAFMQTMSLLLDIQPKTA